MIKGNKRLITISGETSSLTDWAIEFNINSSTVRSRLRYGWSIDEALTTPVRG